MKVSKRNTENGNIFFTKEGLNQEERSAYYFNHFLNKLYNFDGDFFAESNEDVITITPYPSDTEADFVGNVVYAGFDDEADVKTLNEKIKRLIKEKEGKTVEITNLKGLFTDGDCEEGKMLRYTFDAKIVETPKENKEDVIIKLLKELFDK